MQLAMEHSGHAARSKNPTNAYLFSKLGKSNIIGNITANISVPTSRPEGPATITGALFALYGASLSGNLQYFAVNVTVGHETSSEYVASEYEVLDAVKARRWEA
jgi:hypothetical protein